jgi:hypothetical protein
VGTYNTLFRYIEGKAALYRVFIRPDRNHYDGRETYLCPKAIVIYKAYI